jgi:hypothetical protein
MHIVTIERRSTDNLRHTLFTIEGWLAENGIERSRLQIHGGTGLGAVAFTIRFDCPLQAGRFAAIFPPTQEPLLRRPGTELAKQTTGAPKRNFLPRSSEQP